MRTAIEDAVVLTMDDDMRVLDRGYVLKNGKNIAEVGEGAFAGEADERIDARGGILLPGFVNTHCHVSMVPFRTMGDDCPDRLRRFLFPLENEAMTRELVYRGAVFGIGEMLLAGVTTFADMYYFEDEVARACVQTGMRGYLGETLISQPTCDSAQPGGGLAIAKAMFDTWRGEALVRPIVAPHGTTTCDEALLRAGAELAAEHDTLFTLHASEMDYEMKFFTERGETPTRYLAKIGAVNERLLAGHCIHMTQADIEILAEGNAAIAHCIGSNTKAGKGVAPMAAAARAGVRFGLGTDGPSSGNTLSLFDQMRLFADCHKTANHDRALFPAKEIVRAATRGGAEALRAGGRIRPALAGNAGGSGAGERGRAAPFPGLQPLFGAGLRREQFGREPRDGLRRNAGARRKADAARHAGGEGAAAGADGAVYAECGKIRGHHLTTESKNTNIPTHKAAK